MLVYEENLAEFASWLAEQSEIAIDTETTGLNGYSEERARICGVSIGGHDNRNWYLPFRHAEGRNLPTRYLTFLTETLSERAADGSLNLLFWNAKFDLHMLALDGFVPATRGCVEDFMLGAHLLNENEPSFGLKEFCDKYGLGTGSLDERALREVIEARYGRMNEREWKGYIHKLSPELVAPYAETDVILTRLAAELQRPALRNWRLDRLFAEQNDYLLLVWRMEHRGIRLDRPRIVEQMRTLGPKKLEAFDAIIDVVRDLTGSDLDPTVRPVKIGKRGQPLKAKERKTFNPGSPTQIVALTGWQKTDVRFIEELEADDPLRHFGDLLLDYRVLSKMSGTYYDAYLTLVDSHDILRPNYNMHGTVSGRLSCSKPNLQNVPRWSERRPVKEVFIPRDGYVLLELDYEQAELRIATHYADEPRMRDVFYQGLDPHGETAKRLGIPRFVAKTLNFLIIYGGGVNAVVRTLKCDRATAQEYLRGYHGLYPRFQMLSNSCMRMAERDGYLRLESGRIRHFNTWKRYEWEAEPRKAMNSLIQGTASEMLRMGMQRLDDRIRRDGFDAYPLLQVHDSVLLEVRADQVNDLNPVLHEEMTAFGFDPAPAIEVKFGDRWAPMKEVPA